MKDIVVYTTAFMAALGLMVGLATAFISSGPYGFFKTALISTGIFAGVGLIISFVRSDNIHQMHPLLASGHPNSPEF